MSEWNDLIDDPDNLPKENSKVEMIGFKAAVDNVTYRNGKFYHMQCAPIPVSGCLLREIYWEAKDVQYWRYIDGGHVLDENCWCEPEKIDGVYVHRQTH